MSKEYIKLISFHSLKKLISRFIGLLIWIFTRPFNYCISTNKSFLLQKNKGSLNIRTRSRKSRKNLFAIMALKLCSSDDQQFQNVIFLSLSFMLIFTAFQTMANIEQTVLVSVRNEDESFKGDGYTSLAIIYLVFAFANWAAPSIVSIFKAKVTMIIGASIYALFVASFLYPLTYLLYAMSALLGLGAAILWTAQGNYLTLCSNKTTINRNSGFFWAICQCSMFLGNSFVFWQFEGKAQIDKNTRTIVFSVLISLNFVGILCLFLLGKPQPEGNTDEEVQTLTNVTNDESENHPIMAFKNALKLLKRKNMIFLSMTFFYTGIVLSFFSGVYSTSIGFTFELEEAKRLVGLCGILVGTGEVIGGALFGLLGSSTVKFGRDPVVFFGFLCHTLSFYLIFLNLPDNANMGITYDFSYMNPPSVPLAMLCAFLLGFGDACYNTQIYSVLGTLFSNESIPAFAIFKFTQSAAAAASYFYSATLSLHIQLMILQIFSVFGTISFFIVEWDSVVATRRGSNTSTDLINDNDDDDEEEESSDNDNNESESETLTDPDPDVEENEDLKIKI